MSSIPAIGSLPVPAPKSAAPQDAKDPISDAFANLLDSRAAASDNGRAASSRPESKPATDAAADTGKSSRPSADTAAVDSSAPVDDEEPKKDEGKDLLDNLLDLLGKIDTALQNNQPVDPALLDDASAALAAFANYMGIDLSAIDPAAGDGEGVKIDPTSLLGQLTQKAGDLSRLLSGDAGDFAAQLDALSQKLQSGGLSAETLSKLGFALEPEALPAPELATPALKLPESTITRTADAPATPKPADIQLQKPAEPTPTQDARPAPHEHKAEKSSETPAAAAPDKKSDDKAGKTASPAAAGADKPADPVTAMPAAPQSRFDAIGGVRVLQAAYQAPPTQVNVPQLAFDIVRQVQAGNTKFHIRLDPPELGRIDVRMDVDNNGNVTTRLTVEKSETLDLLQRDQRSLEKALAQAGLEGGKTNLEFSLRQNPSNQQGDGKGDDYRSPFASDGGAANDDGVTETAAATQYRGTATAGGLNLFV